MSYSPLANISPADLLAFQNHRNLPPNQREANLPELMGKGNLSFANLYALKLETDRINAKKQADMLAYQVQQAGGTPPPMGQNSTVVDDLQAQIRAALYPQQQQQMPQQMAQGQMPPQGQPAPQMPPQQMAQTQMPTQQMAHGGLAHLPVSNFRNENYAGGGIVAFADNPNQPVQENMPTEDTDKAQKESDRNAMSETMQNLGAAGLDVLSLPVRGVAGALETGVTRPLRALGVNVPYLPKEFYGGDASSMTPYSDKLNKLRSGEGLMDSPTTPAPTPGAASAKAKVKPVIVYSGDMYESQTAGAAPAETKSGLPAVTNAARAAAKAKAAGVGARTPAISAAQKTIDDTLARAKKLEGESDLTTPAITSREKRDEDVEKRHNEALKRAGISPEAHKEAIAELKDQAVTARKNRDTDHLMAAAAGFFSMAGGTSPYALKNMADGFGVTVKNVTEAEKYYRESEKARKASLAALQQSRRAEVLGLEDKKDAADTKYQALMEKVRENKANIAKSLRIEATTRESTMATRELGMAEIGARNRYTDAIRAGELDRKTTEGENRNYIGQQGVINAQKTQLGTAQKQLDVQHNMTLTMLQGAQKDPKKYQEILNLPDTQAYIAASKKIATANDALDTRLTNLHSQYSGGRGSAVDFSKLPK